jgi:hypothetical protein
LGVRLYHSEPKNTVYSAAQEAIIKGIQVSRREERRRVVVTGSLTSLMAVEGDTNSKNPKRRTLRKLLNKGKEKITLF